MRCKGQMALSTNCVMPYKKQERTVVKDNAPSGRIEEDIGTTIIRYIPKMDKCMLGTGRNRLNDTPQSA